MRIMNNVKETNNAKWVREVARRAFYKLANKSGGYVVEEVEIVGFDSNELKMFNQMQYKVMLNVKEEKNIYEKYRLTIRESKYCDNKFEIKNAHEYDYALEKCNPDSEKWEYLVGGIYTERHDVGLEDTLSQEQITKIVKDVLSAKEDAEHSDVVVEECKDSIVKATVGEKTFKIEFEYYEEHEDERYDCKTGMDVGYHITGVVGIQKYFIPDEQEVVETRIRRSLGYKMVDEIMKDTELDRPDYYLKKVDAGEIDMELAIWGDEYYRDCKLAISNAKYDAEAMKVTCDYVLVDEESVLAQGTKTIDDVTDYECKLILKNLDENKKENVEMKEVKKCPICGNEIKEEDMRFGNGEVDLCFECAVGIYGMVKEGIDTEEFANEISEAVMVFVPELGEKYAAVCKYQCDMDFTVGLNDEVECVLGEETYRGIVFYKFSVANSRVKENAKEWKTIYINALNHDMCMLLDETMDDCLWSEDYLMVLVELDDEMGNQVAVWDRLDSEEEKPVKLGDRVKLANELGDEMEGVVVGIGFDDETGFVSKDITFFAESVNVE